MYPIPLYLIKNVFFTRLIMWTGPVWPEYLASTFGAQVQNNAVSGSVTGGTNLTLQGLPNSCGLTYFSYPNGSNILPGVDALLVPMISNPIPVPTFLDQIHNYVSTQASPVPASTIFFLVCLYMLSRMIPCNQNKCIRGLLGRNKEQINTVPEYGDPMQGIPIPITHIPT
jgi:hypothetical protein